MHRSCLLLFAPTLLSTAGAMAQQAATLTVDLAQVKAKASPQLYGLMTEEINYSYDGGLYAELVRNRTFQDRGKIPPSWFLYEWGSADRIDGHRSHHRSQRSPAAEPATDGQERQRSRSGRHQQPGVLGLSRTSANHLPRFVLRQDQRPVDRAGDREPGRG